jgi:hypothetical protein
LQRKRGASSLKYDIGMDSMIILEENECIFNLKEGINRTSPKCNQLSYRSTEYFLCLHQELSLR